MYVSWPYRTASSLKVLSDLGQAYLIFRRRSLLLLLCGHLLLSLDLGLLLGLADLLLLPPLRLQLPLLRLQRLLEPLEREKTVYFG